MSLFQDVLSVAFLVAGDAPTFSIQSAVNTAAVLGLIVIIPEDYPGRVDESYANPTSVTIIDFRLPNPGTTLLSAFGKSASTTGLGLNNAASLGISDFALSSGWGNTAAVSNVGGNGAAWQITVTVGGSGIVANPTITLTFKPNSWTNAVVGLSKITGGTGAITDLSDVLTKTTWVITFNGTPSSGDVLIFTGFAIGR